MTSELSEQAEIRLRRTLKFILGGVSSGRFTGAQAKAKLAILLDGRQMKIPKDVKKLIQAIQAL